MSDEHLSRIPPHERRRLIAAGGERADELAERRLAGEPLQYLEGTAAFADFDVVVDRRVLVPRPETEGLYELVSSMRPPPEVVVDIGTGSGVLAIALARRFRGARVIATDLSPDALSVARSNAAALNVEIEFYCGDLFGPLGPELVGEVDLVVSNPPYVAEGEWDSLPSDVRREPRMALVGGERGTEVYERLAADLDRWLDPGGVVAVEIGETQGHSVSRLLSVVGETRVLRDLAGRDRYVIGGGVDRIGGGRA